MILHVSYLEDSELLLFLGRLLQAGHRASYISAVFVHILSPGTGGAVIITLCSR